MNDAAVDVIAVVGACAPARANYAARLSDATGRTAFSAYRLGMGPDPVEEAISLALWADRDVGAIVELPGDTAILDFIRAAHRPGDECSLSDIVCVVDAPTLIDELRRESYASRRTVGLENGRRVLATEYVAHAMLTVNQIEYASKIVLVNWEVVSTPSLSALMALVSQLAPSAALWLDDGGAYPASPARASSSDIQPGWVSVVNGSHRPRMTDRRIAALHYEQVRPFHPERLERLLEERVERGEFGLLLRSAGFCRLATRPGVLARWDQVGCMFSLQPLAARAEQSMTLLMEATGQNLAFFGRDLRAGALSCALDEATLTDDEFVEGVGAWKHYPDPFPAFPPVGA